MATQIRLSPELIKKAEKESKAHMRTLPKQIEYWAQIGQEIEPLLKLHELAALLRGEAEIRIVPKKSTAINTATVFAEIEKDRHQGRLSAKVAPGEASYQVSVEHPEFLERILANGQRDIGKLIDGRFQIVRFPQAKNMRKK